MVMLPLATFGSTLLTIALVAVSVLMIGLILLQKNRGAGLSGALGGVGGHTAFGTKTGDVMTWITVALTSLFLLLSIVGNYVFEPAPRPAGAAIAPAGATPPVDGSQSDEGAALPLDATDSAPPPPSPDAAPPGPTGP